VQLTSTNSSIGLIYALKKIFYDTKFIAEVCSNHNGSLNRCLKFIKTAKEIGCYGVKFQLFKTEKLFANEILKKSPYIEKEKNGNFLKNL
jgi:sialic acid synthase SpsE